MIEDKSVVKQIDFQRLERKSKGTIRSEKALSVGGREGEKKMIEVFLGDDKVSRLAGKFVSKQYDRSQEKEVDTLIRAYSLFRKYELRDILRWFFDIKYSLQGS